MTFIIFSGLPGSGKSTLARHVAPRVSLPLLDKDDFLDTLFAERGSGDAAWRAALSREADSRFAHAARQLSGACLVSWWRPRNAPANSGTPTDWLFELTTTVIEVYCRCAVATAVDRFLRRQRHPGHLDAERSRSSLMTQFAVAAAAGPLGVGRLIDLETDGEATVDGLVQLLAHAGIAIDTSPSRPGGPNER